MAVGASCGILEWPPSVFIRALAYIVGFFCSSVCEGDRASNIRANGSMMPWLFKFQMQHAPSKMSFFARLGASLKHKHSIASVISQLS